MSNKGGSSRLKRIAASQAVYLERKELKWTIKPSPGPHREEDAVALGFVIRDLLELAENLKEAGIILNSGKVKVDGVVRKAVDFPVGLFDVIEIKEIKKAFRLVLDSKGRLEPVEIKFGENYNKISKVLGKKILGKGQLQLSCNDGNTFTVGEKEALAKVSVGDSLLLEIPKKFSKVLELKKGNMVFVVGGKHVGETAKIEDISPSTMQRAKLITLDSGNGNFQTVAENVIVVGEAKKAIEF
jgi:small subunit ribosomal protein S4e